MSFRRSFHVFFMVAALCVFVSLHSAQAKEFLICYEDQDMPPYSFGGTDQSQGTATGILPKLLSEAIYSAGLTPKFVRFPWKRCLLLLKQNKVDGLFASIYQKERETIGRYPMRDGKEDKSRCLMKVAYAVFTTADQPVHWDGTFHGDRVPKIAAPLGYVVVRTLKEVHNINADTRLSPPFALTAVSKGQLNGYVIEKRIGETIVRQAGLQGKVVPLSPPFEYHHWHLMISHKFYNEQPKVAEAIWDQLKSMRMQYFPESAED